jgi:competence CoiA-like predicted nuclease
MKFAEIQGERFEAQPGSSSYCPVCGDSVIEGCGEHKAWHWAHRGVADVTNRADLLPLNKQSRA